MITSIQAFVDTWTFETKLTQNILDALTDESLDQSITADHRALGQLGWHLATTLHEMASRTGLKFAAPEGEEQAPASAAVIADTYRKQSQALLDAVQSQWTDASLQQMSDMYGEQWPNGLTLNLLIHHEIHHRGQMTVLMRQAGLRVPEIYGPTREGWIERGMQPML